MVKQVGHHHKHRGVAHAFAVIANRRRQVCFAAAVGAGEHQPTARIFCELLRRPEYFLQVQLHFRGKLLGLAQAEVAERAVGKQLQLIEQRVSPFLDGRAVIWRVDMHGRHQVRVLQARADAVIQVFQVKVGGDDRGQLARVAVIDNLK